MLTVCCESYGQEKFSLLSIDSKNISSKKPIVKKPTSDKKLSFSLVDPYVYESIESDSGEKVILVPASDDNFEIDMSDVPTFEEINKKSIKLVDLDEYVYKTAWEKRSKDNKPLILFLSGSRNQNGKINSAVSNLVMSSKDDFNIATAGSDQPIFKIVAPPNCELGVVIWADKKYEYFGIEDFGTINNVLLKWCVENESKNRKEPVNWPIINKN